MEDCRLRGGDPFDEVQLPDAVITLKQGVGRLIRDADDRGVLVICDNRLVMRPYGATFLASLPPAPRTRDIARAPLGALITAQGDRAQENKFRFSCEFMGVTASSDTFYPGQERYDTFSGRVVSRFKGSMEE